MKTIIIEDIFYEAELIKSLLGKFFPDIEIIGEATNVEDGIRLISKTKPDFLLMDIEIMGGTSYDILKELQDRQIAIDFEIIFLTGNKKFDYATKAFTYSALDFLTKPIDPDAFKKAIGKAIQKINPQQYNTQLSLFLELTKALENQTPTKLAVNKVGGVIEVVDIEDIIYLEADREITRFFMKNNQEINASKNLGNYDQLLVNYHNFFSISNSLLINMNEFKTYDPKDKIVTMKSNKTLCASRRGGHDLKNRILEPAPESKSSQNVLQILKKLFLGG